MPAPVEHKDVFGVTFEQGRNELKIDAELLKELPTENKELTEEAKRDLIVSLITLKYTQSNSVCYVKNGQAIGVGAGQQSRVHCTRLAGNKADNWYLRQCPKGAEPAPSGPISAGLTGIIPSTCTFLTIIWMFWQTASGKTSLQRSRKCSLARSAVPGWME